MDTVVFRSEMQEEGPDGTDLRLTKWIKKFTQLIPRPGEEALIEEWGPNPMRTLNQAALWQRNAIKRNPHKYLPNGQWRLRSEAFRDGSGCRLWATYLGPADEPVLLRGTRGPEQGYWD